MIEVARYFDSDEPAPIPLSAAGEQRRRKIFAAAQVAARGRRRRRITLRIFTACLALLCGMLPVTARLSHRHAPSSPAQTVDKGQMQRPHAVAPRNPHPQRQPREIVVARIQTDPGIAARLAVPPQPESWRRLTDDDLLRQLADAGRPAGIAYLGGRATLLYHDRTQAAGRTH